MHAANVAMQVHGGYGYMEESAIPRFYRDAKILTIGEGTSEILKLVIARHDGTTAYEPNRNGIYILGRGAHADRQDDGRAGRRCPAHRARRHRDRAALERSHVDASRPSTR